MTDWASNGAGSEIQFCWDQALRVRPQFQYSYPYASKEHANGLLALQALFASLEEAAGSVRDEEVSRAKLGWWQQELLGRDPAISQHPIVKVLRQSVAIKLDVYDALRRLLESSLRRVETVTISDEKALFALCHDLGFQQMRLEYAVESCQAAINVANTDDDCAAAGLLQLLRESCRSAPERAFWWLPLTLLARHGQSRNEFVAQSSPDSALHLMSDVFTGILDEHPSSRSDGQDSARLSSGKAAFAPRPRHWYVQSALQLGLLGRLRKVHPQHHEHEISKTRFTDAWFAWRAARQWARAR